MAFSGGGAGIGSSIGGLLGGVAVLAGAAGEGGGDEYKAALQAWKKLKESNFDFQALSPPELRVLGEKFPDLYQAVVPREFQQIQETPGGREAQVRSLAGLEEIGREGMPLVDRLAAAEGGRAVTSAAGASRRDALRAMAARGQLGGGDELQAGLAASGQASNLGRDISSDLARQSALRRMQGLQGASQAAGQLRGQDIGVASQNAAIANRYAELFASMKTQEAQDAANARRQASMYNLGTTQRVGEANTLNRYNTMLANIERQNALRNQLFGQQLAKTQGLSGAYSDYGAYKDQQQATKAQAITGIGQGVGGLAGGALGGII